jgi:RimJ/RimL family protein N-acetyltransferase
MNIQNSKRLAFKMMTLGDADLLYEVDQDPLVMKYLNDSKPTPMEEIQNVFVPRLKQYLNEEKGWGIWKVTNIETQEYLGWLLARPMDFFSDKPQLDNLELGWRFKSRTWGQGFASEAAKHLMLCISQQTQIKRFCAIAVPNNKPSIRVMQKIGMRYVRTYLHHDPLGGWTIEYHEIELD